MNTLARGFPFFSPAPLLMAPLKPVRGPVDLALTYRSPADGAEQPFRLFLPKAYDGKTPLPLLIVLHGTGGNQDTYFDTPSHGDGLYKRLADERGLMIVSPHGRGITEYRGIGEYDVLCAFDQVKRIVPVDEDRVVLTGLSMGGTGTSHLCCRYPDLFAGGAPIGSCFEDLTLVPNLKNLPMYYIQGANDWPTYGKEGPIPISRRMAELGYDVTFDVVPDTPHNAVPQTAEKVLDWAMGRRRNLHPRSVVFCAYLPIHGLAYWTEIREIAEPGPPAKLRADIGDGNAIHVPLENTAHIALFPEPQLLDLKTPIRVTVNGTSLPGVTCGPGQEIRLLRDADWRAEVGPRNLRPLTAYRTHRIGTVLSTPTQDGPAETTMGNWMTDAMRDATDADIAIYNRRHDRGIPLRNGQDVYEIDLFDWIRPYAWCLCAFDLPGRDLLEILEDNLRDEEQEKEFLVQVSGCRYAFDRSRPLGARIVETDIDPDRTYRIVCEKQTLSRENVHLAGRYEKIPHQDPEISIISAAWRYIHKHHGRIEARAEGRVRDLTRV